jgi:hypothetical protein
MDFSCILVPRGSADKYFVELFREGASGGPGHMPCGCRIFYDIFPDGGRTGTNFGADPERELAEHIVIFQKMFSHQGRQKYFVPTRLPPAPSQLCPDFSETADGKLAGTAVLSKRGVAWVQIDGTLVVAGSREVLRWFHRPRRGAPAADQGVILPVPEIPGNGNTSLSLRGHHSGGAKPRERQNIFPSQFTMVFSQKR